MILGFIQNIGPWQLVICVVVAFVLFGGAKKIPELAKSRRVLPKARRKPTTKRPRKRLKTTPKSWPNA